MKLPITTAATALLAATTSASPPVQTGLDILIASNYTHLANRRVIMLTNPTGITPDLDLGLDVLFQSGAVNLVGVMGPEHGFRGTAPPGDSEGTFVDEKTGLTVYDAYNADVGELVGILEDSGADTVLFDIQDVGARFYTYIWAMYDSMVAAARANVSYVVIDRPNPTGGVDAFGPVLDESFINTYVGRRAIAQAHGMTVGELARMFVGEGWVAEAAADTSSPSSPSPSSSSSSSASSSSSLSSLSSPSSTSSSSSPPPLNLEVIKMTGWRRAMTFHATGLPWVMPSPNMPTVDTALIYAGTCMFEGTSISEGRGTTRPFELLGAPWANESWVAEMRGLDIPRVGFRFQCFQPVAGDFEGEVACGVQTYVEGMREEEGLRGFDAPFVGVGLLYTARKLFAVGNTTGDEPTDGSFHWLYSGNSQSLYNVDVLVGSPIVREGIENGLTPDEIREAWTPRLNEFKEKRRKYLLY